MIKWNIRKTLTATSAVLLSILIFGLGGCGDGQNSNVLTTAMVSGKTFSWVTSGGVSGISTFYNDGSFWLDINTVSKTSSGTWVINSSGQIVEDVSGEIDTLTLISSSANTLVVSVDESLFGVNATLTNKLTLIPALAAGQTTTIASGQSVEVPSGSTCQDPTSGNTVTISGDHNIINTSAGAIVSVPSNATGTADNTVKAQ